MRKSLLMTTALVAAFAATNVCAEDWTISSNENITDSYISKDKVTISDGEVSISGNNSGIIANSDFAMSGGSLTASSNGGSADTGVFIKGTNSSVTIENGTIDLTDSRIAKGVEDTNTTGDVNISGGTIKLSNNAYIEMYDTNTGSVKISGGELNINDNSGILLDGANNFTMTGGSLTATSNGNSADTGIFVKGDGADVNIQGGEINLTDSSIYKGNDTATSGDINISGGNITLNKDAYIEMRSENTGNVNMSGGKLVMNENSELQLNTNDDHEIVGNAIKLILNGYDATVTANGSNRISGNIDFTKGKITVAHGATLTSGDITTNSEDAKIDLSGKLEANVNGSGNLYFKNSSAEMSGNVAGSNLTFEADHFLSQAISGTIGDLASLNVNNGTLTYDKQTGVIDNLNIAGNLNVAEDLWVFNNIAINDGTTINLQGKSLNSRAGGIDITGGTINMNNGSNDPDLTLWAAKDINISGGTINMNGDNASIDTFYDLLDSSGTLLPKPEVPGNINITGGTINVNSSSAEISSEGQINIAGNAILNITDGAKLSSFKNWTYVDDDIEMGDKATINLIDNGTINLSGKLVSDISGDGNLNVKTSSASVDGNVSGSNLTFDVDHSLSKAISGTIGDLASLNVNNGTLTYDKQTGKIGSLNVAGGLDIGTNTVNATNVNFADNSTLGLKVASADNYGQIKANTISIGNDTTMKVTLDSGVIANGESKSFNFLQGNVTGDFTNKIADNNRYNISFEDGSFKITGTATASDVVANAGGSANNAKTAEAWDNLASSATASAGAQAVAAALNELSQNNKQAYVAALTAIAPEVAPAVQSASTETTNQVFGAVGSRLSGGSVSTGGEGMSSGDNIFERAAVWVQTLFNKSKLDDTSKAKGFDADTNGVALGAEKFVNDDVKVGVGYAYSQTDIDGFMRSTDVDTHTAILYGEYKPSNWYVNSIATYGWSDYSEKKNVAGVGVKADSDVETFGLQAMGGYDMNIKGFGVTPEAGLRYVHIKQNAYKDSADQKVSGNDSDILTGVIGAKVSKSWELSNGMNIKPEARIAATYDLMNDDVNSVVTLANGSAYAVDGKALDRFGIEFGAGVTADINDNVELSLGYEGKFRQDYQDHTGLLNAKYKF